jgi:hypothetical protein
MFNPTQLTGLIMTALVVICCLAARKGSPWRWLAALHALFFAEILFGWRHRLHNIVNLQLMQEGIYSQRAILQIALLALASIIALALLIGIWRAKRLAARIGLLASSGMALLFLVEAISLHSVDAILYRRIGPAMLIAFLWAGLCAITMLATLLDRPKRKGAARKRR